MALQQQSTKACQKVMLANELYRFLKEFGFVKVDLLKCLELAEPIIQAEEEGHAKEGLATIPQFLDSIGTTQS